MLFAVMTCGALFCAGLAIKYPHWVTACIFLVSLAMAGINGFLFFRFSNEWHRAKQLRRDRELAKFIREAPPWKLIAYTVGTVLLAIVAAVMLVREFIGILSGWLE